MSQKPSSDTATVRMIPIVTAVTGAVTLLILLIFFREANLIYGFLVGLALVIINFLVLTKIVAKFVDQNYKRKSFLGLLFFLKLLLILGILFLAFKVFHLSVLGFALGFGCLIPSILIGQLKGQESSASSTRWQPGLGV